MCALQKLSANPINVISKRTQQRHCINIFFISTHSVEVCNGLASISALHPIAVVSLVVFGIITGVVTEYLYRKLKPFFASKPALM